MTVAAGFIAAVLVLLLAILVMDLRAAGRPVGGVAGLLQLDSRQASHCDGCRRAVHLQVRPWVLVSMGLVVLGLGGVAALVAFVDLPDGLSGTLLCLTALLAIAPLGLANRRASMRVREQSDHDPGH